MLSKCANPDCANIFRYLHEGKLFRLEANEAARLASDSVKLKPTKPAHHLEFFWLCDNCAARMTLVYRSGHGVCTRMLTSLKSQGSSAA